MLKNKKIILIFIGISLITILLFCTRVFAASTSYGSSLRMDANSTCTGSTREYYQRNHQISIVPKEIQWGTAQLTIKLHRKSFFSDSVVYTTSATLDQINHTYIYYMGNHDTGKFYYFFSSSGHSPLYAEPVTMTSYD